MPQPGKILIVEDNDFVRMQIIRFLEGASYEIVEASDGRQALDVVEAGEDISLAIVDVRMEPVDGFEFIRALRGEDNRLPVILVTGDQNSDLLSETTKLEIAAVLMKPVEKDRLLQVVAKTIEIHTRKSAQ